MDRPELPESIESLSLDELKTLLEQLRPYATETLAADEPDIEFLETFADVTEKVAAEVTAGRKLAAAKDRASAALATSFEDEPVVEDAADPEPEPEADEPVEDPAPEADPEPEADEPEADPEPEADAGDELADESLDHSDADAEDESAELSDGTEIEEPEVDKPDTADLSGDTQTDDLAPGGVVTTARVVPGVPGFEANAEVDSSLEVAKALGAKWETVAESGTGERFTVVTLKADYPDFADFTDGNFGGFYDDAIVAACAPLTPYYGVGFYSSEERPVFNSIGKFAAPRGGVTIYSSPRFSDANLLPADTGFGQWTLTDDNNPSAEKNDPYDFVCGDTLSLIHI